MVVKAAGCLLNQGANLGVGLDLGLLCLATRVSCMVQISR